MCCKQLINDLEVQDKEHCFTNSTVAKEHGKEFRIEKSKGKSVCKVKTDDCLITSQEVIKCDYFFRVCETSENLLVEFKDNTNITHAVRQIIETYNALNAKLKQEAKKYRGFIISSSVPGAAEQRFRRIQEKTLKDQGILIQKRHNKMTIKI